jgi:hypothetical protein
MKYAVEVGSGAMIYIPSFRHSKFDKGTHRHTARCSHKPTFIFFFSKYGK